MELGDVALAFDKAGSGHVNFYKTPLREVMFKQYSA